MSRIADTPVNIPGGVQVAIEKGWVRAKGPKGELQQRIHPAVKVLEQDGNLLFASQGSDPRSDALAGTMRAVVGNMVTGVSQGFEKRLTIVGVGYRALVKGRALDLTLGFSHPVNYAVPDGVTVETPSQTEIIIRGADKQQVGQVAAEIRAYRPPEPYKGKGVRYTDEHVIRKQAKKK